MLIQFSIRNYKIFKEKAVFSLVASNYDKDTRETENVRPFPDLNLRILKGAVIYGANASGKSKFMEALNFMRTFTLGLQEIAKKATQLESSHLNSILNQRMIQVSLN